MTKVVVMGLDCATPELMFSRFSSRLPNLMRLTCGVYGRIRSTTPPITIPAWYAMFTGQTPGRLGLYGFRHRTVGTYDRTWIADAQNLTFSPVWRILGDNGKKVGLVGIPPSYPPYPVNGFMVSCFLTPDVTKEFTYPADLGDEILSEVGEYIPDVPFRTDRKAELLEDLYMMTEKRFDIIEHLMRTKEWDFFAFVEIGLDRIQHAYWRYFDPEHHLYEENEFSTAIEDYYAFLDSRVGSILDMLDEDTYVIAVSDHGAKRMKGAFCINDFFRQEGLLSFDPPDQPTKLDRVNIDWSRTQAWGWGGYYARVFLNVEGREPKGTIPRSEYEDFRDHIADLIRSIRGPEGERWNTCVYRPEDIYPVVNGDPPDLMVFFDDLSWRSAGTVGHVTPYLEENDTGPDDAVHDWYGVFMLARAGETSRGVEVGSMDVIDVAPIILRLFGMDDVNTDGQIPEEILKYIE